MLIRPWTLIAATLLAFAGAPAQTPIDAVPVAGYTLPFARFLGFGSANTAVTTGAVPITRSVKGRNLVAIGCAGQFATSNWAAAVTDSAGNTYLQLGANSGTYPQANSTTQACIPFLAVNALPATTATFTISGSNSATTTVSLMVWDVANTIPSLASVDGWAPGTSSSATALSTQVFIPSHANEVVIAAGCASTGTITLASNSALTFDSGSQAIASGSNCVTAFGGSAVMGDPAGVTGSFTDGSAAAYSEVVVVLKGYDLSDSGNIHLTGNMLNGGSANKLSGTHPTLTTGPPQWSQSSAPASGNTAAVAVAGVVGKSHVITGFCYSLNGDATGAASTQAISINDGTTTFYAANASVPSGISAVGVNLCTSGMNWPGAAGATVNGAFGGNVAHALESIQVYGYDIDLPNVVY